MRLLGDVHLIDGENLAPPTVGTSVSKLQGPELTKPV